MLTQVFPQTEASLLSASQKKSELRKEFLTVRKRLHTDSVLQERLNEVLFAWLSQRKEKVLGLYFPYGSEPDSLAVMRRLAEERPEVTIAVPVVESEERRLMHYVRWLPGAALVKGAYGILVPKERLCVEPQLVVAPCIAFNPAGFRLGSGGGYFDRYLKAARDAGSAPATALLAFSSLLCPDFEPESLDEPFDFVVTEEGVKSTKNA